MYTRIGEDCENKNVEWEKIPVDVAFKSAFVPPGLLVPPDTHRKDQEREDSAIKREITLDRNSRSPLPEKRFSTSYQSEKYDTI